MRDFNNNSTDIGAPEGWREAFAALPPETPPADGWARFSRALDVPGARASAIRREHRMSWAIGFASAAVLVIAAWAPLSGWRQDRRGGPPPAVAMTEVPGLRGPAAPVRGDPIVKQVVEKPAVELAVSDLSPPPSRQARRNPVRSTRAVAKASRAGSTNSPAIASTTDRPATGTMAESIAIAATNDDGDLLQKLKAQSAQLEALVALARDDRVANASSELLSSQLDAGIAAIDATLSQPGLAEARRQELWRQRVDLLQQLAGIEATSRWLAAQGASGEATLVSVY